MVAFEPSRYIDQHGKGSGVAFRKPVFGKAFDLAKTTLRDLKSIPVPQHAIDKLILEGTDGAHPAKRSQRPAKVISLFWRKSGTNHGNLHRLFLKQRDAKGFARHLA